jgi:preprotein translocase subunit SecA
MERVFEKVERALAAQHGFHLGRDYVIQNGQIAIVDESTGRTLEGRKWENGLHQAIETKERLVLTEETQPAARITVQSYFRLYEHLSGLTGTASEAAGELRKTYGLGVSSIPTHRPCVRQGLPPRVFKTLDAKMSVVADEIQRLRESGRAILVGTPMVENSEALAAVLSERGVPHQILNCRNHKDEAEIIEQAGQRGNVTVATNMAGRGTDIKVDPVVRERGGLHVIGTEMHTSCRIDRQLIGRTARQGEPGSYQFFVSLEDDLLRWLQPEFVERARQRVKSDSRGELPVGCTRLLQKAQRTVDRVHRQQRRNLLKYEQRRNEVYARMGLDRYLEAIN